MPKFLLKRWHGLHIVWTFVLIIGLIAALAAYHWVPAFVGLVLTGALAYFMLQAEKAFRKDLNEYIGTLSHRVKKAGSKVMQEMPIGILVYSENKVIEWHNPYLAEILGRESAIGETLQDVLPELKRRKDKEPTVDIPLGDKMFRVQVNEEERLLFFHDITWPADLEKRYQEEKLSLGVLMMDNLEEATQGMDDQTRSIVMAKITGEISEWAQKYNLYLRRTNSDRYFIVMNQKALQRLEQDRFEILDEVRDLTGENKVPFTLSIGIAAGPGTIPELGQVAQSSLDMALGRGGDQVAVKVGSKTTFYGGKTNAVEKRTRVRARVISHALRELIKDSDKVVIMGHRLPDLDSVGAAIGVLKAVQVSGKDGYIVLEGPNPSIQKLMLEVEDHERLGRWFITPDQAMQMMTPRTLAVVVDTHKASMVAEPRLLQQTGRIVVIDHHRRGEEFIQEAVLVYLEPYASSTCELVTELLQYFHDKLKMDMLEATSLLAGIAMDTKNFSLRTGARTFDAASFLRRHGADMALIQRIQKEDLQTYVNKAEVIKHAEIVYDHIAIAVTEPGQKYSQLLIAQVADTLLNMTDIYASFVVSERPDGLIGISARSLGDINVQLIMERLGGGGHLTNAATQLETTLEQAESLLKQTLEEIEAEEGLFE
ncbi:DHH family phosphoesterase [Paenibacillus sp. CC-CFT747]|nr:DHH family phosphoesterase [Paenibacillus sp. CC-CFT747]